jgi:hypothetical protein
MKSNNNKRKHDSGMEGKNIINGNSLERNQILRDKNTKVSIINMFKHLKKKNSMLKE